MHEEIFAQFLKFEKRYSPHTVISYLHDVADFFVYLSNNSGIVDPTLVNHQQVRRYVVLQVNQKKSPASIRRYLSALKTYYRFLMRQGIAQSNPAARVLTPKLAERLPKYIEQKQMAQLLDRGAIDVFPEGWTGLRDRVVLELLYDTGMRRDELLRLSWNDIDLFQKTIRIFGKGNKQRLVPLVPSLEDLLKRYKYATQEYFNTLGDIIVLTDKGSPAYENFIYRTVKKYLSLCSSQTKKSPHVLRHSFATHLSNNGAKLNDVKELLGHASLASTQVYTHNSIEKLKEAYKLAHPKA